MISKDGLNEFKAAGFPIFFNPQLFVVPITSQSATCIDLTTKSRSKHMGWKIKECIRSLANDMDKSDRMRQSPSSTRESDRSHEALSSFILYDSRRVHSDNNIAMQTAMLAFKSSKFLIP